MISRTRLVIVAHSYWRLGAGPLVPLAVGLFVPDPGHRSVHHEPDALEVRLRAAQAVGIRQRPLLFP